MSYFWEVFVGTKCYQYKSKLPLRTVYVDLYLYFHSEFVFLVGRSYDGKMTKSGGGPDQAHKNGPYCHSAPFKNDWNMAKSVIIHLRKTCACHFYAQPPMYYFWRWCNTVLLPLVKFGEAANSIC